MRKETNSGTALLLVAGIVLAVLTIVPEVGWIIRQQARTLVGGPIAPVADIINPPDDRVLQENPNDYELQLGGALRYPNPDAGIVEDAFSSGNRRIVAQLEALQTRFPTEPSLPAHILRYLCRKSFLSHREPRPPFPSSPSEPPSCFLPDSGPPAPCDSTPQPEPIDPVTPELLEYVAAQGEVLDPDNAYYPTLLAVACFAQNRDAEARNALTRAAEKPRWDDYVSEEFTARVRLDSAAQGETGAMRKFFVRFLILLPQYGQIRALARVAVAQAVEMELQGRTTEALALRKSLARLGMRIRTDSTTAAGSLVGGAITLISASRPGGIPALSEKEEPDDEKRAVMNRVRYLAYLNRIGAMAEASWYIEEWNRVMNVRGIHDRGMAKTDGGVKELTRLILLWLIGILPVLNALWMFLLGGVAVLLSKIRRIREEQSLPRGIVWGFGYVIIGPLLAYGFYALVNILSVESKGFVFVGVPLLTGLLFLPFFFLKRGTDWRGYGRSVGAFLATVATTFGLIYLFHLSLYGILQSEFYESLTAPFYLINDIPFSDSITGTGLPLPLLPGILPVLCLLSFAIWSWRQRIPASVGIVWGFKRNALPLASFLLLAYAFTVVFTAVLEGGMTQSLQESTRHEGRYLAQFTGEEWPGER